MKTRMASGEWTAESVGKLVGGTFAGAWKIAEAHNGAVALERDKANVRETELICERDYFKEQLRAEREKVSRLAGGNR